MGTFEMIDILKNEGIYNEFWAFKRTTKSFGVFIENLDNPEDYEPWFTVKKSEFDSDEDAVIGPLKGTVSLDEDITYDFELDENDLDIDVRDYYFDVKLIRTSPKFLAIPVWGKFSVFPDITNKTELDIQED